MSNHDYSRRRAKSKGDIIQSTERVSIDQVTGETVVVPLDAVQVAFESIRRWYDTTVLHAILSSAERERLADMMMLMILRSKRHTERDMEALADLLEWMNTRRQ